MKVHIKYIVTFLLLLSFSAFAQEINNRNQTDFYKEDFIVRAASSFMMEIELGNLAMENSKSPKVKNIAEKLVRDHSKAFDKLKNIAQQNHIQLPDSMLDIHKMHVEELSELSGEEFDRAYLMALNENHEKTIQEFKDASQNYEHKAVRDWARQTLSVLKEHKELVTEIRNNLE
jgi:putative membrane protein